MRREWIEIPPCRNMCHSNPQSPSMRREWIEITAELERLRYICVSLHAEGVD